MNPKTFVRSRAVQIAAVAAAGLAVGFFGGRVLTGSSSQPSARQNVVYTRQPGQAGEGFVGTLKEDLGVERVICFGDSDNDLSMFAVADECYAPSNAKEPVKKAATAVIGHHDEEGISEFLRERFALRDIPE